MYLVHETNLGLVHRNARLNPYPSFTIWISLPLGLESNVVRIRVLSNTNALFGLNQHQIFWPLHTIGWR